MPRPRFEKIPPEKRRQILDAAAREFAEKGYDGASLNRIIDDAGVSKGAMYYYFDDKEDLFHTVIVDVHEEFFAATGEFPDVPDVKTFWRASEDFFAKMMSCAVSNPVLIGLYKSWNAAMARGELSRSVREDQKLHFDFHRTYVARGQQVGAVRRDLPDDLLLGLLEAVDDAGDHWFAMHFEELAEDDLRGMQRSFFDLYRRILEPREKKGGGE
jgi:TetR/AcrR family transcriptional regulator